MRCNTNVAYVVPHVLTAIGLNLSNASIQAFQGKTGGSMYAALVANPSTGKTKALNLIQNSIEMVEVWCGIEPDDSMQVLSPTIESLLTYLQRLNRIIGKFLKIKRPVQY